jgi:restriction endonuclease S subunit
MTKITTYLSSYLDVKTGYPLREGAKHDAHGDALLIQMKDVDTLAGVDWQGAIRIQTKGRKEPDWLLDGDILFVGRGSRFFAVQVKNPPAWSIASPHFYVLRTTTRSKINPQFFVWLLNSKPAQKFYAEHVEGSSLPYINRKALSMLPVNLPDVQTQESIIKTHSNWKQQRRLLEELIEQKEALVDRVLEKSIQQGVAA